MLKKYKIILAIIVILLLLFIGKEVNAANTNLYRLKDDTAAKNSNGSIQLILPKDTVVNFIEYHKTNKKYAFCEYKVKYMGKKYIKKGYIGVEFLNVDNSASYIYREIDALCVLNYESVVKNSYGGIEFILPANSVVKYIKHHDTNKKYALCEYKVNYMGEKHVKRGYILATSLKLNTKVTYDYFKINSKKEMNVIVRKAKIVYLSEKINKLGVTYSDTVEDRVAFYNGKSLKTDCSSLCATIYNRILGFKLYRDSNKENVWTVPYFVDNAEDRFYYTDTGKKGTQGFEKIKEINNGKGSIPLSTMQIGDCIAIGKSYARDEYGENMDFGHIYMYIGDGRLIEAISYDGGNDVTYDRVVVRNVPKYFYTAQRGDGSGQWYYIIQIRPLYKYMSR